MPTREKQIPQDVLTEILGRLPSKSLIRFRCVSYHWSSLISSSDFISCHLKHSTHNDNHLHVLGYYSDPFIRVKFFRLHPDDNSFPELHRGQEIRDYPFERVDKIFKPTIKIVGSCNGVLCLNDGSINNIALWNPSIRKCVPIPYSDTVSKQSKLKSKLKILGFGFDSIASNYKLVRVVECYNNFESVTTEIYSVNTRSWQTIITSPPLHGNLQSSVFLKGACHWLLTSPAYYPKIITFDFNKQIFGEIDVPNSLIEQDQDQDNLTLLESPCGLLSLITRHRSGYWNNRVVWVMKDYGVKDSWTKLLIIEESIRCYDRIEGFRSKLVIGHDDRIIGFQENGELILTCPFYYNEDKLASYDLKTKERRDYNVFGNKNLFYWDAYVESLVLLNEKNEKQEEQEEKEGQEEKIKARRKKRGNERREVKK